jgi:uncharacterized protein YndB with AHSA1/START domain
MSWEHIRTLLETMHQIDEQEANIDSIASKMQFQPTRKKKTVYKPTDYSKTMAAMTYAQVEEPQRIVTVTTDGKETENVAQKGDIVMSGPSQEQYVIKPEKFAKLYQGQIGSPVMPDQTPRMVAQYTGKETVQFTAPWGSQMVLKPGDYLVKDGDAGYYRIARAEYEQTYNPPGK